MSQLNFWSIATRYDVRYLHQSASINFDKQMFVLVVIIIKQLLGKQFSMNARRVIAMSKWLRQLSHKITIDDWDLVCVCLLTIF